MSMKWKNDMDKTPSQESEDSMSQALADLGMLEQGMTLQDKRDLLNVVRLSKKSAEAEEEGRKTKDTDTKDLSPCSSPKVCSGYQSLPKEVYGSSKKKNVDTKADERDIFPNISLTVTNSNMHNSPNAKVNRLSSSSMDSFECRNGTPNGGSDPKLVHVNSPSSSIIQNNKDCEVVEESGGDPIATQNKVEDEENNVSHTEHLGLPNDDELQIIPSSVKLKQKDLNDLKKTKDERERNIDVFSHSSCANNHNLNRRSFKKNQERVPFYFVPEGMNLGNYIAYFKCYVNQYYKKLAVIQKNNIEHLEWGAPITLEMSSFTNFRSCSTDANSDNVSKRYNFRDRCSKPKLVDFTSENSEDAEEEESNDEDIFVPRHKRLPGIKLSTKRKNTSANDSMSTKKEKKESPQKKLQDDVSVEEDDQGHIQSSDNPDNIISKARGATPSQPVIVIAEGPSMESTPTPLDDFANQPSSMNIKQRRVQIQHKSNGRVNRRKSEPRKNPDIVIVDEEVRPNQVESVVEVNCPICWNSFPAPDIEEHASECNQYSPDNTCSSAKV